MSEFSLTTVETHIPEPVSPWFCRLLMPILTLSQSQDAPWA